MSEPAPRFRTASTTALTFLVGRARCALDVGCVLFLAEYRGDARAVPIVARGMLGLTPARGDYVPLYDLAQLLGVASHGTEARELSALLDAREQDHVAWLDALATALHDDAPFDKTTDPQACAFGRWYQGFHTEDADLRDTLALFDDPHRAIHALGTRLLALAADGHRAQAQEALRIEGITTLNRLRQLFALARERLASSVRPVTILVADDDGRPRQAWLVDAIEQVREFPPEALHDAEALGVTLPRNGLVRGMLRGEDSDFLWLAPAADALPPA